MSDRRIVDIAPLLDNLKEELDKECDHPTAVCSDEATADEIDMLEALPVIDPDSLRPSARWIIIRRMADGAKCKCEHCGREETFTTFDPHTQHVFCCRCGYKMEGFCNG